MSGVWACEQRGLASLGDARRTRRPRGADVGVLLHHSSRYPHIPVERTAEICADFVQHRVGEATVLQASAPLDTCIAPSTEAVKGMWRDAEVLHVDEAGLRVTGPLPWLPVACTERLTSYEVHAKRGHEAMDDAGMLGACRGTAVHDHWKPYCTYDACDHALCHAHHLRERGFIATQYQPPWAKDMADLLREIQAAVEATPVPAMSVSPAEREAFEKCYDDVVQTGCGANPAARPNPEGEGARRGRPQQPPPVHLLIRLRDFTGQVLTFMADLRMPFDNNQGERDIRMVVSTQGRWPMSLAVEKTAVRQSARACLLPLALTQSHYGS